MYQTSLEVFKTREKELHQKAENYRLVKFLEQPYRWTDKLYAVFGRMLITLGQNLVKRTQTAH
jgi:hypothetical protein